MPTAGPPVRETLPAAAALLAVGMLAGCGAARGAGTAAPSAASRTGIPPAADPSADGDSGTPVPTTVPVADARLLAAAAMTAYIDHTKAAAAWYAALAPDLSTAARSAYAGTNPTTIPAHVPDGGPVLQPSSSSYLATFTQNTDAGTYTVLCSRADDGNWQVERITPPTR